MWTIGEMSWSRTSSTRRSSLAAYTDAGGRVRRLQRPSSTGAGDERSSSGVTGGPVGSAARARGRDSRSRRLCIWAAAALLGLVMSTGVSVLSADRSQAGQPDRGAQLAAVCASCHRVDGRDQGIPSIIGLDEATLVAKMVAFRSDEHSNQIMRVMSLSLSADDLTAVAHYLAAQHKDTNPR